MIGQVSPTAGRRRYDRRLGFFGLTKFGEHVDDLSCRRESVPDIPHGHQADQAMERDRNIGAQISYTRKLALQMSRQNFRSGAAVRSLAGQQMIKRTAQRVNVRTVVDPMRLFDLLRGHEQRRAQNGQLARQHAGRSAVAGFVDRAVVRRQIRDLRFRFVIEPDQSEVEQFDDARFRHEKIRRLHIPMHQTGPVNLVEPHRGLPNQLAGVRR